jgi:hypothetical protein
MTGTEMYWLLMLDNISTMFVILCFVSGFAIVVVSALVLCATEDMGWEDVKPFAKPFYVIAVPLFIITCIAATMLPTTKQMAAIIVVPKIINNETVQELPAKLLELGVDWIEELKPDVKE